MIRASKSSWRARARIWCREGKSLIFYAYDLSDPRKVDAKVSFYVWGERLGAEKPIRSLGIFRNDDANDGRWVLTFEDPQVLAQINSVFVTVESSKKLNQGTWRATNIVCLTLVQAQPPLRRCILRPLLVGRASPGRSTAGVKVVTMCSLRENARVLQR